MAKQGVERKVALCYSRKSVTRDKVDLVSIVDQEQGMSAFCKAEGYTPEWYRDAEGHKSGRREKGRKEWLRLKRRLLDPDVAVLIVYIQDRASRSVLDTASLLELCEKQGVHFVAPQSGVDTRKMGWKADTVSQIQMRSVFAQYESGMARDRLIERVAQYRNEGIHWGTTPFGMTRVDRGLDAKFKPNTDAETVVKVMTIYASGLSYDQTAAKCNETDIMFRGRDDRPQPFSRESVRTIVGNVLFYSGYLIGQTKWDAKASKIRLEGEGTYLERYARATNSKPSSAITPIISVQLANDVIERRANSRRGGRQSAWIPLITPIAWNNGKKLRAEDREYGKFYTPRSASGAWINAETADENTLNLFDGIAFPPQMIERIRQSLIHRTSDARRVELKKQLDQIEVKRGKLLDLHLVNLVSREDYNAKFAEIEREITRIKRELEAPTELDTTLKSISDIASTIRLLPREAQRRSIHRMFERIEIDEVGAIKKVQLKPWLTVALSHAAQNFNYATDAEGGNRTHKPEGTRF